MIAYKCDRCGTFDACDPETCRPKGWLVMLAETDEGKGTKHLCGDCHLSIVVWMATPERDLSARAKP